MLNPTSAVAFLVDRGASSWRSNVIASGNIHHGFPETGSWESIGVIPNRWSTAVVDSWRNGVEYSVAHGTATITT